VGKHCRNRQCFKEKTYKAKLSTSSIVKKINKDNLKKTKKKKKKYVRNGKNNKKE